MKQYTETFTRKFVKDTEAGKKREFHYIYDAEMTVQVVEARCVSVTALFIHAVTLVENIFVISVQVRRKTLLLYLHSAACPI